jgi:protein gp37
MPIKTNIHWADYVSNPIKALYNTPPMPMIGGASIQRRGWACVKVSPGCENCWASTFNVRLGTGAGMNYTAQNMKKVEVYIDQQELKRMVTFKPRREIKWGRSCPIIFVCDMTDLFGEWVSDEWIDKIFGAMWINQNVDWVVLTKRVGRMAQYAQYKANANKIPLNNIYLGCTVEDFQRSELRVHGMRMIHDLGWKTLVSYEPALSSVNWEDWYFLDWLICGGESGKNARPMDPQWAREARDFCVKNSIPFFFKQNGEFAPHGALNITEHTTFKNKPVQIGGSLVFRVGLGMAGRLLDGREWNQVAR